MSDHVHNTAAGDASHQANHDHSNTKNSKSSTGFSNIFSKKKEAPEAGTCATCDPEPTGKTSERIERLDEVFDKETRKKVFLPTAEAQKTTKNPKTVLKVRRLIDEHSRHHATKVDIISEILRQELLAIFKGAASTNLNSSPPEVDPELMFHAYGGLKEKLDKEQTKANSDDELVGVLCVALQYIEEDFGATMETLKSLEAQDEITFELLWTLFPPNTHIYSKANVLSEEQLSILSHSAYGTRLDGTKYYQLVLQLISHDRRKFGWVKNYPTIATFEGATKVQDLPFFPFSRHANHDKIRESLHQRGKRFVELCSPTYQEYVGQSMGENRNVVIQGVYKQVMIHVVGRVMIDPVMFSQHAGDSDLVQGNVDKQLHAPSLMDADFMFCDHKVAGFSFHQKIWCLFAISNMSPVVWNEDAFSKLVLRHSTRDLIHALVKSHKHARNTFDDVVSGKGLGLVGLLSGNPGVGKTLTAEVIAEATKRPLYMLSAGELGTEVKEVDERLSMVLEITRVWGCVLLIDEADVFLQKRDVLHLQRNALVSIFLRRLEYFQGVLLMTTNRESTIDPAFESRIHFKLQYPDLTAASRRDIWSNCLASAAATSVDVQLQENDITELAGLDINGRQIKNAIACAVSIAVEEEKPLTMRDVKVMLDMVALDE
ncbi:P-loop containing nucleoside triphosphate hydrolase protein [Massarina eburnea CBS 473.64]|uniref:P-loop containing nucleoside triphosphate hydrolase protein n=1 Tax=Massarina eburnea CBS 473.64 TaxID=1395130 RepID=A0A6A6RRY9_9PLEO|nr:P-loop containing nucleoside triphosphate hydrolase protein [Massarina eburnea CBS 473.64]